MLSALRVRALPAGLLALLATWPYQTHGHGFQWPYNLPPHVKYHPEDEALVKKEESIQQSLQHQPVLGVKKMAADKGEKFFLDYWTLGPRNRHGTMSRSEQKLGDGDDVMFYSNTTVTERTVPPFLLHSTSYPASKRAVWPRNLHLALVPRFGLGKRNFQCPIGTSSCSSIDRSDSCCAEDQTCQLIEDTGLGDVGCCAAGETCAGALSECAPGYTSCPDFSAGGCCVPGYTCVSGGCLFTSTATVVIDPSPPPGSSPSSLTRSSTSPPTSASSISSAIRVPSTSTEATASATTSTASACSSGFRSCPASLGSGCCPTDRACGRDGCPELTSTATVRPPARPTSNIPTTASDASITGCPTGFYACSAFHQGGCCRHGRDCAPTSCPQSDATSLIDDNGITIVAPTGSDLTANSVLTGDCATGWSTCGASDGGGCCPTGYACGNSCTATATESGIEASSVGKIAPNVANSGIGKSVMLLAIGTGLTMLFFQAA